MRKRYYNAQTLRDELDAFERRFGLRSEELVARYDAGAAPERVPRFEAFVWAGLHRELARMLAAGG